MSLALGPWLVRLADTGPVAAGFWRLALAFPVLLLLAFREPAARGRAAARGRVLLFLLAGGLFFALDLASWHLGIMLTKLGNAALFGNSGSLILMLWGLVAARRAPHVLQIAAIVSALAGAGLLMSGSLEISQGHLTGDLLCLLAGFFYAFYILFLNAARRRTGQFTSLAGSILASAPVMLLVAALLGENFVPSDWTPLVTLAITSQLVGQGLLIYSLANFPPLVIGLALLTQPAVAALIGWLAFGEALTPGDVVGMALLAAALILVRLGERR